MSSLKLFADRGCPFAHRVLSLFDHLGLPYETSVSEIGSKPQGIEAYSRTGRIPLLVHGDVVIGESRVILEHVSEAYGFASAYPSELARRTLQRHAMAVMDGVIAPRLFRKDEGSEDDPRLGECLDAFERAATEPPEPSLFAFHLAPMWLRFQWWRPESPVARAIRKRAKLASWLDAAAALPPVARTAIGHDITLPSELLQ